jgi:MFS family permease
MLTYGIIGGLERMCLPVLFKEMSTDLGLNLVSIGTIWGLDPLAGVFISLPGGLLADRFGAKKTLIVVCLLGGILSALRGFSNNFASLALTVFLFGLMSAIIPGIVPKTTAVWFSRRYLSLTNALLQLSWYVSSIVATMMSATVLSPLLGGWRNVLFILSAPAVIMGILWWTTGKEPEKSELSTTPSNSVPLRQAFLKVVHTREVWIIGLIFLTLFGASSGFMGYLALYLRNIGWSPVSADSALTVYNVSSMIGIIPMILLSNRIGGKKRILVLSIVMSVANLATLPFLTNNWLFVLLIVTGFLRSAAAPICVVLIFEAKGIGSTCGGTAISMASAMGMLGSFAAPPLGNALTAISPGAPFIFWAGLSALALPLAFYLQKRSHSKAEYSLEKLV